MNDKKSKSTTPAADGSRPPEPDPVETAAATTTAATPPKPPKDDKGQKDKPAAAAPTPPAPKPPKTTDANAKPPLPEVGDLIIDAAESRGENADVIAINNLIGQQHVPETRYHFKIRKNGHICNLSESELRERYDLRLTKKPAAPKHPEE